MSDQQFGLDEKIDADGPVPEARSDASHLLFSRVMATVKFGVAGPRWMTTVTFPSAPETADKTWGAVRMPFWVPVM